MAELYDKDVRTINEHLVNIYNEEELVQNATIRKFRIVRLEGVRQVNRQIDHYNLEAILAVGYRVRSQRGTQFRQWATQVLQEYLIKGFAMDDERLKNPPVGHSAVPDYFDEMLERIRDIRASERRVYLRVKEIFTMAADYEPSNKETTLFFQTAGIKDGLDKDEGGHLIASIFNGPGEQVNYAAMDGNLNKGAWKRMENQWADALKADPPEVVEVEINIVYENGSKRPEAFDIFYEIDGEEYAKSFTNSHGSLKIFDDQNF